MVTRPTATVTVTVDAMNDARERLDALMDEERRLTRDMARTNDAEALARLDASLVSVRASIDAAEAELGQGRVKITVKALSLATYRNLLKNHPPVDEDDKRVGYNLDTFLRPLLEATLVKAVDHAGQPVDVPFSEWLDEDEGLAPVDTLAWFYAALNLQTGRESRGPQRRAS